MSHITPLIDDLLEHCTPYSGHHERYHIALRQLRAALAQPEPVSLTEYELWKSYELMAINAELCLPMNLLKPFVQAVLKLSAAKGGAV